MKRRVIMNNQKMLKGKVVRLCSKHDKMKAAAKENICTHIPTVQCHEEVMIKLSPYSTEDCVGELDSCNFKSQVPKRATNKSRPKKESNVRSVYMKSKDVCESVSAPIDNGQKNCPTKIMKSKSVPHLKNHNLEDSVDFIPVKLSNNDCPRPQNKLKKKHDLKVESKEKSSRQCKATWDKLLKGETQTSSQNYKPKETISNSGQKSESHLLDDESLPNTPKKKVSINVSNNKCEQDGDKNHLHKFLDSYKTDKLSFQPFFVSDPVKTLDFLIKQLREKLMNQPEIDNLEKIILDMENALVKISVENEDYFKNIQGNKAYSMVGSTLNGVPKSVLSNGSGSTLQAKNGNLDIAQLQRSLEESCLFLQSLCIKQRESCSSHIREKEQLTIQLAESRRLLAISKSREKDYEVSIGELRLKIQESNSKNNQQSQSVQELTDTVSRLRAENEMLASFREAVKKLNVRLKETACEKEILQSKLCLKDLEIEKLKVLLEVKENLQPGLKHKKMEGNKEYVQSEMSLDIPIKDKDKSFLSLSTVTSWTEDKPGLVCSSHASSSPRHSPSPYNSWQHMSSIYQRPTAASELNKNIVDIFQNLKRKTEQNKPPQLDLEMLSSGNSFWSDKEEEDVNSKMVFSDHDSEALSS